MDIFLLPLHADTISIMSLTELLPTIVRPHTLVLIQIVVLMEAWLGSTPGFLLQCHMSMSISLILVGMSYNVSLLSKCASVVDTIDEGPIILILSQYAHKPDSKTIHSKSQVEHFGGIVYCRILGLTTFNSLLQCVNRLVWEVCSVN